MDRRVMLDELRDFDEGSVALAAKMFTEPSELILFMDSGAAESIWVTTGTDQGCPRSPALFALGMRRVLKGIHSRLDAHEGQLGPGPDCEADAADGDSGQDASMR